MRLYRTNCTLSSDDGPCVEMKLSGGGRVAVAALSPVQMRRILMHDVALLPIREIAEREGCSERAVKYSLHRARKRLR